MSIDLKVYDDSETPIALVITRDDEPIAVQELTLAEVQAVIDGLNEALAIANNSQADGARG